MIEELEVKGFRSLRDARWRPGRLNVVIGPNGSGKSNLLRVLDLIQSAAEGSLSQEILNLGGITQALWDGQAQELSWRLITSLTTPFTYTYAVKIQRDSWPNTYNLQEEALELNGGLLLTQNSRGVAILNEENIPTEIQKDRLQPNQTLLSLTTTIGHSNAFFVKFTLESWVIYHHLRVDQDADIRQAAIARVESHISPDGQNLVPVLHTLYTTNRDFRRSVDSAMSAAFGQDYEELIFPPAADQKVQLRLRWKSLKTEQSAANLSDGTLRFLLLVAILANPEPGDLIAIDEPETGLHPSMLPIIAELAAEASQRTQVILTTHSPQFLDAFTGEPPTTTVAEWVDGETKLSVLDGDELRRWLQHYSLGAMFRSGELEGLA